MTSEVAKYDPAAVASMSERAERRLTDWLDSRTRNTAAAYVADLGQFALHVGATKPDGKPDHGQAVAWLVSLDSVSALEVVEGWQAAMVRSDLSSATINRRTVALNACLRHLARAGIGPGPVDIDPIKQEARKEVVAPSTGSIARVIEELSASADPAAIRDTLIILLAAQRGLRKSEITALTVDDVDGTACTVKVRRKGHKERVAVSIEGACCEALGRWLAVRPTHADAGQPALFVTLANSTRGQPMSGQSIYNVFQSRGGWHPHQLRHSAIEETLRMTGNNLPLAQALAGHADPSTTMGYVGRSERRRIEQEAVGKMAAVYRLSKMEG